MQTISTALRNFVRDEEGATAVEYGLMVALIAVAIAFIVFNLGNTLNETFNNANECINTPSSC